MIDQLKISLRGSCAFVGVEDIGHRKLSIRQHHSVCSLRATQLIEVWIELLGLTAQIDRLAENATRHLVVRRILADFVRFTAGIARHAKGVAETESLVDLWIDPDFRALPRANPQIQGRIERFPTVGGRAEALQPLL